MNATHDLERRLADYYASEAPQRAPDRVLHGALAAIDSTTQRHVLVRVPWRSPFMNSYAKFAIAAVAVIAIGAVGLAVFRPGPISEPGIVTPSGSPSPAPSGSAFALTERFDSSMHGISLSYPAGWTPEPATLSWQTGLPGDTEGARDVIDNGASDSSFLALASQPLAGRSGSEWASDMLATPDNFCGPLTEGITVAGATGVLAQCSDSGTNGLLALLWDEVRGYWILSYRIDDRAFFDRVLDTVQLRPAEVSEVRGRATNFARPFDYVLPSDPAFDNAADEGRYFEVRVPEWADAGHLGGLIIQAVGGGRSDPCDASSAIVPLEPGADAVLEYLVSLPQLAITDLPDTTLDGRPARQALVTSEPATSACEELYTWSDSTESFEAGGGVRVVVAEVDGENVVVTIYGERGNPEWPAMADDFLASMRFQP